MNEETTRHLPSDDTKLILARLDSMDRRFDSLDKRFDSVEARLDSLDGRVDSMDVRLITLEEKVDRRLQETRPIWESVLAETKDMNARLTRVEDGQKDLRRLLRAAFSDLSRVQEDFEERLDKLEAREVPK